MNQIKQHIIPFLLVFQFSVCTTMLIGQTYEAKLKMDWEDGSTLVEGLFLNHTKHTLNLNFQLIIERKSKSGNVANNRQSGSFQILPSREKLVTLTHINIDELDFYRIYFKVYKKGKIIAEDYIVKWEELSLELSDRNRLSNEEKKRLSSTNNNHKKNRPTISFYEKQEANQNEIASKLKPAIVATQKSSNPIPEKSIIPQKKLLQKTNPSKKRIELKQDKKQTYTTPSSVKTDINLDDDKIVTTKKTKVLETQVEKEQEKRQQATKNFLTELIEQQKAIAKQTPIQAKGSKTKAPIQTNVKPKDQKVITKDVEFGGLIFDDSRTKTGRDFYDIFYANYIPPKGAENFNITIKELPGRGRMAQIAVLVNDNQVLLRLLQPRAALVEEQAIQSVFAIEGYLKNAAQLKKQLESADQQGSGIF